MAEMTEMAEIIRLMRETGEDSFVEKMVQNGRSLNEIKTALRERLIETPLEKLRTLSDLSGIKRSLQILGGKLNQRETSKMVKEYLEKTEYIGKEGEKKYHWQGYLDQLLILVEIGSFSQETADKLLLKPFDRHFSNKEFSTTGQVLELSRKLMPMASESAGEILRDWYFKGITEKEVPESSWSNENVEETEVDRDTMIVEANKVYDKIVFKRSCVVSGSLTAVEVKAEGNLVIFGDITVERAIEIKSDLIVTGKLGGGNYRSSEWHGNYHQSASYTGHVVIGRNLIANSIKTYASLDVKGDIVSENITVPEKIQAKNILTPGILRVYHKEQAVIEAEDKIVADSVLTEAREGNRVKSKEVVCLNTLKAHSVEAERIEVNKTDAWLNDIIPENLKVDNIVRPDIGQDKS